MEICVAINPEINNSEMRIHEATFVEMSNRDKNIIIVHSQLLSQQNKSSLFIGASCDPLYRDFCNNNEVSSIISLVDINSFREINELISFHNGIVVQTPRHKSIMNLMTDLPVFLIHENMDPLYLQKIDAENSRVNLNKSVCWVGYGINFNKSLTHLVPVIKSALSENLISDFKIHCRRTRGFDIDPLFEFVPFNEENIRISMSESNYCLLSHIPLDMHINTLIKSPNKLISAINAGVLPICSNTPSYSEYMNLLGLDDYLFTTPNDLHTIFKRLDPGKDKEKVIFAKEKLLKINEKQILENIHTLKNVQDIHRRPIVIDKKSVAYINNFETLSINDAFRQLMIVLEIETHRIVKALIRNVRKIIPSR